MPILYNFQKFDGEIKAQVDAAVKSSKTDPEIGMDELPADIYVENLEGKIRGTLPWQLLDHKRIGPAVNA